MADGVITSAGQDTKVVVCPDRKRIPKTLHEHRAYSGGGVAMDVPSCRMPANPHKRPAGGIHLTADNQQGGPDRSNTAINGRAKTIFARYITQI